MGLGARPREWFVIHKACQASRRPPKAPLALALGLACLLGGARAARAGLAQLTPGPSSLVPDLAYQPRGESVVAHPSTPFVASCQSNGNSIGFAGFNAGQPDDQGTSRRLAFASTNTSRFDTSTAVSFSRADMFRADGPIGDDMGDVARNVTFKNAFHPTGPADTTVVAVPLPPAFYTGLGVLMACGVITLLRRFMGN